MEEVAIHAFSDGESRMRRSPPVPSEYGAESRDIESHLAPAEPREAMAPMAPMAPTSVMTFDVGFFGEVFHSPCWKCLGVSVTPAEVLDYPDFYPEQWRQILDANATDPILVSATQGTIIDGVHLLCRAVQDARTSVSVRLVRDTGAVL